LTTVPPNGYNEPINYKGVKRGNMAPAKLKQFIYIVQAAQEVSFCKIGKTNDLERRLKEYNNMTGRSQSNIYQFVFSCEVKDMAKVENDITEKFSSLREKKGKEIYFFNDDLFEDYVKFIKEHKLFVKEIFIKQPGKKQIVKIVKLTTPTLEERGVTRRDVLQKAQKLKNNEFFTRYEDVEKELSLYAKSVWKNKTVFCNCDDAVDKNERKTSAFSLYFLRNFFKLGLKKLICTHYDGPVDLFNQGPIGYVFTKEGFEEIYDTPQGYTGSFDDPLSLKILKEDADIVCTNPPFSRSAEYWKIVIESGKKFLIISGQTNPVTAAFIPYFMNKKVWGGYNRVDWFLTPKRQLISNPCFWYTNIPVKNRPRYRLLKITQLKNIPEKHKRYDDKKMLLVNNCFIPSDYKKPFAVSNHPIFNGLLEKGYKLVQDKEYYPYINGKKRFARVLVKKT
jgi:predicted GIY-YIG superfamily endonuclease